MSCASRRSLSAQEPSPLPWRLQASDLRPCRRLRGDPSSNGSSKQLIAGFAASARSRSFFAHVGCARCFSASPALKLVWPFGADRWSATTTWWGAYVPEALYAFFLCPNRAHPLRCHLCSPLGHLTSELIRRAFQNWPSAVPKISGGRHPPLASFFGSLPSQKPPDPWEQVRFGSGIECPGFLCSIICGGRLPPSTDFCG